MSTIDEKLQTLIDRVDKLEHALLVMATWHHGQDEYVKNILGSEAVQCADADKVMNSSNNLNGWISVKERLPEIDKYVLVTHRISQDYTNLKVMEACRISDDEYEIWGDHAILADYVDYWMPLPEAPKGEE